jgi:uncharacterized repeat protein (TIGR04138 family)
MQAVDFDEVLDRILKTDFRYQRDAYLFVREALDYTQRWVTRSAGGSRRGESSHPPAAPTKKTARTKAGSASGRIRHVTGQQLLEGIRLYALQQFGPMALTVLEEWGVRRCEDFGEIVFNMVENRLLGKTESDSRDDFKGGYDFHEAFRQPFAPGRVNPAPKAASSAGKS